MSTMCTHLHRGCPSCKALARRYTEKKTPHLSTAQRADILITLADTCIDPDHIEPDGKRRDPQNPRPFTLFLLARRNRRL